MSRSSSLILIFEINFSIWCIETEGNMYAQFLRDLLESLRVCQAGRPPPTTWDAKTELKCGPYIAIIWIITYADQWLKASLWSVGDLWSGHIEFYDENNKLLQCVLLIFQSAMFVLFSLWFCYKNDSKGFYVLHCNNFIHLL